MADGDAAAVVELLTAARAYAGRGAVAAAWRTITQVAELARAADDAGALADAAVVLRASGDLQLNAGIHALCTEALHRLGSRDTVRAARLKAQLVATASPFLLDVAPVEPVGGRPEVDDAEATFLWLQARHAEEVGIDGVVDRLRIADAAIELGRRSGVDEYVCWGRRWRLDAHLTLGDPVGLTAELDALQPLVDRQPSAGWRRLVALVRATRRSMRGDFAAALACVDDAVAADPGEESSFFALVARSDIARLTGDELDPVSAEVEARVESMPYLARGWSALMAMSQGRRDDVELWWRSLVPHLHRMPSAAPEWIVAQMGHAELCCWLEDREAATTLFELLLPYSGLHAGVFAYSPYGGPVDLALGRLARLIGDHEIALTHLRDAERSCSEIGAWPYLALTRDALADQPGQPVDERRHYAEGAAQLAVRLGMGPLARRRQLLQRDTATTTPPLTPRESEIAALVAEGLSNADVARRLTLSVRTVENHVSHVLDKLQLSSRAAVAGWAVRHQDQLVAQRGSSRSPT